MNYRLSSSIRSFPLLVCFTILLSFGITNAQQWEMIGPHTGEVKRIWPSPWDSTLLFVRGNLDGDPVNGQETYHSASSGQSFFAIDQLTTASEILFNPFVPDSIWCLTDHSFVYWDDGWISLYLQSHGGPTDGRFMARQSWSNGTFAICRAIENNPRGEHLYVTTDAGNSWTRTYLSNGTLMDQFVDLEFDPFLPFDVYAIRVGTEDDPNSRQFYTSVNMGEEWTPVGDIVFDYNELRFDWVFDGVAYATRGAPGSAQQSMISEDGCETWSIIVGPNGESNIRVTQLLDGRLCTVITDGIYARSDPDAPWVRIGDEFDTSIFDVYGCELYEIRVHPADEEHLFGMNGHLFIRSLDGGATWSIDTGGFNDPGQVVVKTCLSDPATLVANGEYATFITNDRGESWRGLNTGLDVDAAVHSSAPQYVVCWTPYPGQDQTVMRKSADGGGTWENVPEFEYVENVTFHPQLDSTIWVLGEREGEYGVYRSDDWLESWTFIGGNYDFPIGITADPVHSGDVFTWNGASIFRCGNGEDEFSELFSYVGSGITQVTLQPDGDGLTVKPFSYGEGWLSLDRGETFLEPVEFPNAMDGFKISWNGDLIVYGYGRLHVSTDIGLEWEQLLDTDQFVLNADVTSDRRMYAATQYSGIWMLPDALSVDEINIEPMSPTTFALANVYPNPFNSTTTLVLTAPQPSLATVEVFNLLGQHVETLLMNEPVSTGQTKFIWDAGNAPAGVYFVLASDQALGRSVQRVILLK